MFNVKTTFKSNLTKREVEKVELTMSNNEELYCSFKNCITITVIDADNNDDACDQIYGLMDSCKLYDKIVSVVVL